VVFFEGCDAPDEMREFFASLRMTGVGGGVEQEQQKQVQKQSKSKRKLRFSLKDATLRTKCGSSSLRSE